MIDFPASPTDGQIFSATNGVVYKYSAAYTSWLAQNPAPPLGGTGDFCANQTSSFPGLTTTMTTLILTQVITGNSGLWYSVSTGRYTPPAGRFCIFATMSGLPTAAAHIALQLRKNGTVLIIGQDTAAASGQFGDPSVSLVVDANGSDFFDIQGSCSSGTATLAGLVFQAYPLTGMQGPTGPSGQIGWRQIARVVPTAGQATVDFTSLPSDINDLELRFDVSPTANATDLYVQFYDNTGTLDATANHYTFSQAQTGNTYNAQTLTGYGSGGYAATNGVYLNLILATGHVANTVGIRGSAKVNNIRDSARLKGIAWQCDYLGDGGTVWYAIVGSGNRSVAGAITGLRIAFNTTTLAAGGAVALWGSP